MRKLFLLGLLVSVASLGVASTEVGEIAQINPDHRVLPVYPPAAYAARYDCSVIVAAVINEDGTVGEVEVMDATHPKLGFEQATIDAVKQWKFEPAMRDGKPVASVAAYQLDYRRRSGGGASVSGQHVMTQFTPNLMTGRMSESPVGIYATGLGGGLLGSPGTILKRAGFLAEGRVQSGLQTITIPDDARKCEMCTYSREGIFPTRFRVRNVQRPN